MIVEHEIVFTKTQTKMMDCWYACIQMLRSGAAGTKTKPQGTSTLEHRSTFFIGSKLDFSSQTGMKIIAENGLIDLAGNIRLNNIDTLAQNLQTYGPIGVGGLFGLFNTQGHFIVISGCNTETGKVSIYDPAWGKGKDTKCWTYIKQHVWTIMGDTDAPSAGSFVSHDSADFFSQPTRARR